MTEGTPTKLAEMNGPLNLSDPNFGEPVKTNTRSQGANAETRREFRPSFEYDRNFLGWLREVNSTLMLSSYKTNYIISIGITRNKDGRELLSFWLSNFERPMGLYYDPGNFDKSGEAKASGNSKLVGNSSSDANPSDRKEESLWVASAIHLWRFRNQGPIEDDEGSGNGPYDASFEARRMIVTNDIDNHDLVIGDKSGLVWASPLFSCLCQPSNTKSFKLYWKPPWSSRLSAEDRSHVNGVCLRDGEPRYITAISRSDVRGGWREHRRNGGVIWDIKDNRLVCSGLSMPHSPRWHKGRLWVLESGTGYLGYVDFDKVITDATTGEASFKFVRKAFIPGFLRGLTFVGSKYAVVGCSQDRHENIFQGLELGETLVKHGIPARCGLYVVDLVSFDVIHNLTFEAPLTEIYDVIGLPGYSRSRLFCDDVTRKYTFED